MEELFLSFLLPLVLVHDYLFPISDFSPITGQKPGFYTSSQRGSRIITSRVILEPKSPQWSLLNIMGLQTSLSSAGKVQVEHQRAVKSAGVFHAPGIPTVS